MAKINRMICKIYKVERVILLGILLLTISFRLSGMWIVGSQVDVQTRLKATFHLTISMRGQCATGKIQRNNYHHGSCGSSSTGKTMSVFFIFRQGTHRNVKKSLSEK